MSLWLKLIVSGRTWLPCLLCFDIESLSSPLAQSGVDIEECAYVPRKYHEPKKRKIENSYWLQVIP